MAYAGAYARQEREVEAVVGERERGGGRGEGRAGTVLLVEHDPVITVSRRAKAPAHVLASPAVLERAGVALETTNRGGDVTYHGPGQLVVYPILDLSRLGLGLHEYMRLLEQAVIDTLAAFGVAGRRDETATGVWVGEGGGLAKVAAMGVHVRRWVSMHGLALNVTTDLSHFGLIVPCGLVGRPVTSLARLLGPGCPGMGEVKRVMVGALTGLIEGAADRADRARSGRAG